MLRWIRNRRRKRTRKTTTVDFDFLPLFFWDQGLSETSKIMMCLIGGGKAYREKTLMKLQESFNTSMIDELRAAIEELEFYGYISNEEYKGDYGEQRVDRRICICPNNRLPKIVPPTGGSPVYCTNAYQMFDMARRLGFIAETGKDTTYLLYDALRIFSAVENVLYPYERVILPQIGPETIRKNVPGPDLRAYPHAIVAIIITTHRLIIVQEDSDVAGRQAGLARLLSVEFSSIKEVALDEVCGRITVSDKGKNGSIGAITMDMVTDFALTNYKHYYSAALKMIETNITMPPLSYRSETQI